MPEGLLVEGANTVTIRLPGDTGMKWDMVMLESVAVTYPRRLTARGGQLEFEASGDAITIDGDSDQWNFGDDVIIGGSEANLTTKQFIRTSEAKPHSRNLWKRG